MIRIAAGGGGSRGKGSGRIHGGLLVVLVGALQPPVEKLRSCLHNEHVAALRFKYARITWDKLASAIVSVL
jgi:hypothetical protein